MIETVKASELLLGDYIVTKALGVVVRIEDGFHTKDGWFIKPPEDAEFIIVRNVVGQKLPEREARLRRKWIDNPNAADSQRRWAIDQLNKDYMYLIGRKAIEDDSD